MTDAAGTPVVAGGGVPRGEWRTRFLERRGEPAPGPPPRVVRAASLAYAIAAVGVVAWGVRGVLEERSPGPLLFNGTLALYPASLSWSVRSLRPSDGSSGSFHVFFAVVLAHALAGAVSAPLIAFGSNRAGSLGDLALGVAFYATWFGWLPFLAIGPVARGAVRPLLCAAYGPLWFWLWFTLGLAL